MSTQHKIIAGFAALILLIGGYWFKTSSHTEKSAGTDKASVGKDATTAKSKPVLTVETITLSPTSMARTAQVSGGIFPWQEMIIGSENTGLKLDHLNVDIGTHVKKGQTLATLSNDALLANIAQLNANISTAKVALLSANQKYTRGKLMGDGDLISKQQLEDLQTAVLQAKANLEAATAAKDVVAVTLSKTVIVAPDAGTITSRTAAVGSIVSVGTELFRMIRQDRLEWRAELTAEQLVSAHVGQRVDLNLPNGQIITGQVRAVSPIVDAKSRKALVYIDIPSSPFAQSGMFASGQINLGVAAVQSLPQTAVIYRDGFAYVFVVDSTNHVQQLKVGTGHTVGDQVEILTTLAANARIVKSGGGFLNQGDFIAVAKPAAHMDSAADTTKATETK